MRGGGGGGAGLKMGVPHNNGGGGGGQGDHHQRPSKLMMMREDYHKKILKEKEERMVHLYEENQKKAMARMRSGSGEGSGGVLNVTRTLSKGDVGSGASVRDFFNERRQMQASGVPVPPIDHHFRQAKGYSSPGGMSSRTGSGNSTKKCSAGRDRSQPLAPIRHPNDTRDVVRTGNTPRAAAEMHPDPNPFNARPQLVKHKPLPPTNNTGYNGNQQKPHQQNNNIDKNNNDKPQNPGSRFGYQGIHQQQQQQQQQHQQQLQQQQRQQKQQQLQQQKQQQLQQQQQQHQQQQRQTPPQRQQPPQQYQQNEPLSPQRHQHPNPQPPPNRGVNGRGRAGGGPTPKTSLRQPHPPPQQQQQQQPKMTDFQKWQLEQNKTREDRLKKFNNNNTNDKRQGYWDDDDDDDDDNDDDDEDNGNNSQQQHDEEEEDDDVEEVRRLERELLEKIEREKVELDRIRREKTLAEEEEKREIEENKKREKLERAKQKKLEEQRRKEEIQRRKEEEEDERRERQREERDRKEEEKRHRGEEKRRQEEDKLAAKREKEEQKRLEKLQKQQAKDSARRQVPSYDDEDYDETPIQSSRRSPPIPTSSNRTMQDVDEMPAVSNASDSSYYAKIAKSSEAKGSVGSLAKCKVCGRSFAVDRLKKHQTACSKANKPRKEFDSSKKRVEGTEAAKYVGKNYREPPKKKNNWRSQHEEFINSLQYAKKAAQYEKEGKDIRQLTPPPTKENPDLVACPSCGRTFNATAAERHIPRCKDLKTKPPPTNKRRR